jgi:hypothetical protein
MYLEGLRQGFFGKENKYSEHELHLTLDIHRSVIDITTT